VAVTIAECTGLTAATGKLGKNRRIPVVTLSSSVRFAVDTWIDSLEIDNFRCCGLSRSSSMLNDT